VRGAALGASDCEAIHGGWLAQPAATLSSAAFLAAAAWLACRLPARGAGRVAAVAYAGLVAMVGVGSVDYHGPQSAAAAELHDIPVTAALGYAIVVPAVRLLRGRRPIDALSPRTLPVAAMAITVAGAAYLLGRTDGPLCMPDSLWQPHALWHSGAAVAMAAWGTALWPQRARRPDVASSTPTARA
jgi:hypothetical protein